MFSSEIARQIRLLASFKILYFFFVALQKDKKLVVKRAHETPISMRRSPSPLPTITVLWDFITVRTDIYSLGAKVDVNVKAVFTSRKLSQTLSVKENKPPIVNTQCVVDLFSNVICAMQIMSGTLPDTYINAIPPLGNTSKHSTATIAQISATFSKFWGNVTASLIV